MSSSGLIYAFIVGAWAVYLVPMWLRREDELNKARQTQRYTAAIKVLSNKDSFERRYSGAAEQDEAQELPLAAGQSGSGAAAGRRTLDRVKAKERERELETATADGSRQSAQSGQSSQASRGTEYASSPESGRSGKDGRNGNGKDGKVGQPARPKPVLAAESPAARRSAKTVTAKIGSEASASQSTGVGAGPRTGLRARRRRVVGALFAVTSLGAIVSADLGLAYVWAMLLPAAVLSGYIAWVRKDERARAAERARRRALAVRAAREAERRRIEAELREVQEAEQFEREELARRSAAARRRVAAARSRAERRLPPGGHGHPDQGDLPRAANG